MQLISFARGAPSLDIIDVSGLKDAAVRAFEVDPAGITAYGTSVGYLPLRTWIAQKHGVEADQVIVTNGSMQADALLFEHLVKPGDAVVVERPTYDRTLLNLRNLGAEVHPVTVEADGLDVEELRALLEGGVRPVLAHIIPNFQNPAGVTLSAAKRTALLALAQEYGFTIFEDDPYADIRWRGEKLPTMLSQDTAGVVVHASSFTKTIAPGLRVGYLVGPKATIAGIAKRATTIYISPSMVAQAVTHQFCVNGDIERSIMVGDSVTDIATAQAARVKVVAVDFGYTDKPVRELGPDRVISHFDELDAAIASLLNGAESAFASAGRA